MRKDNNKNASSSSYVISSRKRKWHELLWGFYALELWILSLDGLSTSQTLNKRQEETQRDGGNGETERERP